MKTLLRKNRWGDNYFVEFSPSYMHYPPKIADVLSTNKNISSVKIGKRLNDNRNIVEFKCFGKDFCVFEPWNDSSEIIICPVAECVDTSRVNDFENLENVKKTNYENVDRHLEEIQKTFSSHNTMWTRLLDLFVQVS